MFSSTITKIRALIEDGLKSDEETFSYNTSLIFTLSEPNVTAVTDVDVNGADLDSGETYSFSTSTNKCTVTGTTPTVGDEYAISYSYYAKYSDTELTEYIRAAMVYISVYSDCQDYELETDGDGNNNFEPTPDNKQLDMIALVAAILINPDWLEYKLPNITIKFPRVQTKEVRVRKLIVRMASMSGYTGLIDME